MIIKVLFFAQLKDAFGMSERSLEVEEGVTVRELAEFLFEEPGCDRFKRLPVLYSINEDFVEENRELKDKDTLALLPPVAGG